MKNQIQTLENQELTLI